MRRGRRSFAVPEMMLPSRAKHGTALGSDVSVTVPISAGVINIVQDMTLQPEVVSGSVRQEVLLVGGSQSDLAAAGVDLGASCCFQ